MKFEFVTTPLHPSYPQAMALYKTSFPLHEQREALSQEAILGNQEYRFSLIYEQNLFIGLALYWEFGNYIYVEHLAILPEMRNKQYGKLALTLLAEENKVLILEIDPPIDDISIRRKGFYERNGFIANPYPHLHPPYHKKDRGHELVVMTSPRQISEDEYLIFRTYLNTQVMKNAF